jgi:hypothetical protein
MVRQEESDNLGGILADEVRKSIIMCASANCMAGL